MFSPFDPDSAGPDAPAPRSPVEVVAGALAFVAVVSATLPLAAVVVSPLAVFVFGLIGVGTIDTALVSAASKLETIDAVVASASGTVLVAGALVFVASLVIGFWVVVCAGPEELVLAASAWELCVPDPAVRWIEATAVSIGLGMELLFTVDMAACADFVVLPSSGLPTDGITAALDVVTTTEGWLVVDAPALSFDSISPTEVVLLVVDAA